MEKYVIMNLHHAQNNFQMVDIYHNDIMGCLMGFGKRERMLKDHAK